MAGDANNISFYELLDKYQFKFYKYYHVLFKVGLKPNEVHTLSIILSFNKAGQDYIGSCNFLSKELNITSRTALNTLTSLINKGFIRKQASKGGNVSIYSINEKFLKDIFFNYENFSQKLCKNFTVNYENFSHNKNIYKNNNKNIYAHLENEQVYNHEDDKQKESDNHSSNTIKQETKNKAIKKQNKELNELQEKQFDKFWQAYPKKVSKKQAQKSWKKINPSLELFEKILKALEMVKQTEQWKKDNGKFIPYPATWLNQERWNDEIKMMQDNKMAIKEEQKTKPVYYPVCENMLENDF